MAQMALDVEEELRRMRKKVEILTRCVRIAQGVRLRMRTAKGSLGSPKIQYDRDTLLSAAFAIQQIQNLIASQASVFENGRP